MIAMRKTRLRNPISNWRAMEPNCRVTAKTRRAESAWSLCVFAVSVIRALTRGPPKPFQVVAETNPSNAWHDFWMKLDRPHLRLQQPLPSSALARDPRQSRPSRTRWPRRPAESRRSVAFRLPLRHGRNIMLSAARIPKDAGGDRSVVCQSGLPMASIPEPSRR